MRQSTTSPTFKTVKTHLFTSAFLSASFYLHCPLLFSLFWLLIPTSGVHLMPCVLFVSMCFFPLYLAFRSVPCLPVLSTALWLSLSEWIISIVVSQSSTICPFLLTICILFMRLFFHCGDSHWKILDIRIYWQWTGFCGSNSPLSILRFFMSSYASGAWCQRTFRRQGADEPSVLLSGVIGTKIWGSFQMLGENGWNGFPTTSCYNRGKSPNLRLWMCVTSC